MHGAHAQLQNARPRAVDTNASPAHPLPAKSSCSEHSKAGVLRGRLIVSLEQPRVGAMPLKALFASACPPDVLRRRACRAGSETRPSHVVTGCQHGIIQLH